MDGASWIWRGGDRALTLLRWDINPLVDGEKRKLEMRLSRSFHIHDQGGGGEVGPRIDSQAPWLRSTTGGPTCTWVRRARWWREG
jgi:hypothetical protein